jgi:hypothetical protein
MTLRRSMALLIKALQSPGVCVHDERNRRRGAAAELIMSFIACSLVRYRGAPSSNRTE